MDEDIFLRIIESVEKNIKDKSLIINEDNFIDIIQGTSNIENKKIAFIDGGQTELLKAASFSLQFIRTAAVVFKNNKKIDSIVEEFFVLVTSDGKEHKAEIFPVKTEGECINDISINSLDDSITEGNERASVSKIGGIARRFAELDIAEKVMDKLDRGDCVVLDGSLKSMVKGEDKYINRLFSKGIDKNIIVCSLAKTNNLLDKDGNSVAGMLNLVERDKEWQYPIDDDKNINNDSKKEIQKKYSTSIVKLNSKSNYVFEFNINKMQKDACNDVLCLLTSNSTDAVFPGYPYGLIYVDKTARVNNEEKRYLFAKLQARSSKKWQNIGKFLNILNSHDILDNIY